MKKLRHVWGFLLACCAGVVLPLAFYVWWQLHQFELDSDSGAIELPSDFWPELGMTLLGYAFMAVTLGGGTVMLLWLRRCIRFRSYALAGSALGLVLGTEIIALTWFWDGPLLLLLRLGMPTASLLMLTCTYWLICIRGQPNKALGDGR